MDNSNYGLLINQNTTLHRNWFKEMARLLGVKVIIKIPRNESKDYTDQGELVANYQEPIIVYGVFQEYIDQKTSKLLGWNVEQDEEASIIHLPYDIKDMQVGALVIVPSALDKAEGRVFRISEISTTMIYPASIACKLAPEWENELPLSQTKDFTQTNFNLLKEEEGLRYFEK